MGGNLTTTGDLTASNYNIVKEIITIKRILSGFLTGKLNRSLTQNNGNDSWGQDTNIGNILELIDNDVKNGIITDYGNCIGNQK